MRITKSRVIIGFVVLFLLLIGVVGTCGEASQEDTTVQKSATHTPASQPSPTLVSTTEPTAAPTPEPTAEACPTQEEQGYLDSVARQTGPMGEATTEMTTLFKQVGESPALIQDDAWKARVALQFTILKLGSDVLFELSAPTDRTKQLQVHVQALALSTNLAVDSFVKGIDDLDVEAIALGNQYLTEASSAAAAFADAYRDMCE